MTSPQLVLLIVWQVICDTTFTVLYRFVSKLLSSHQSQVLCGVDPLLDGRGLVKLLQCL